MTDEKLFQTVSDEELNAIFDWFDKSENGNESRPYELASEPMQQCGVWIQVSYETELDGTPYKHLYLDLRHESGESYAMQTLPIQSGLNKLNLASAIAYLIGFSDAMFTSKV